MKSSRHARSLALGPSVLAGVVGFVGCDSHVPGRSGSAEASSARSSAFTVTAQSGFGAPEPSAVKVTINPDAPDSPPPGPLTTRNSASRCAIDDAEDGDNRIIVQQGRGGFIYTVVDEVGSTIAPLDVEHGGIAFRVAEGGAHGSGATL